MKVLYINILNPSNSVNQINNISNNNSNNESESEYIKNIKEIITYMKGELEKDKILIEPFILSIENYIKKNKKKMKNEKNPSPEQEKILNELQEKINQLKSLKPKGTYYDYMNNKFKSLYDPIMDLLSELFQYILKKIQPEPITDKTVKIEGIIYKSLDPKKNDLENLIVNISKNNFTFNDNIREVDDMLARLRLSSENKIMNMIRDESHIFVKKASIEAMPCVRYLESPGVTGFGIQYKKPYTS